MANDRPETPRTQTSAPVEPPRTTRDAGAEGQEEERRQPRRADEEVRGDRMPAGADEPGAGM